MDGSAGKRRKQYVDRSNSELKTCIIHGVGYYYYECQVLGDFGTKYAAAQNTKDRGINPLPRKIFQKNQENHAIINNVVDEILLNKPRK